MNELELILSQEAVTDLSDIWGYIGQDAPEKADEVIDELYEKCELLAKFPHIGRRREELVAGLRSFPVGRYLVYYRVESERLEIVRILSSSRDVDALF